jgi:hypothetical protein
MSATDVLKLHVIHHGDLRLEHDKLYRMLDRFKSEARPDVWFLGQPNPSFEDRDGYRYFTDLPWSGHLSGRRWNTFLELLAEFDGEADFVVLWEDGEITGVRLRDHDVTEHKVVFSMGDELT